MNFREMRLLIALMVILGGGGGGLLVYQFFVKPLGDANTKIKSLKSAVELKQEQFDATMAERKLLERARLMSLSPNPHLARAEYDKYLYPLLVSCKLDIEGFSPTQPSTFKDASATQAGNALKPTHQILATEVKAKGDLESLVKALELIQRTPLMHRIKSLTIDRDMAVKNATDRLNIKMIVEAMIVGKAEPHSDGPFAPDLRLMVLETVSAIEGAPIGIALLPWIVGPTGPVAYDRMISESGYRRQYRQIALKNIFNGLVPLPAYNPAPSAEEDAAVLDLDPLDVREYVRLDMTESGERATFRNLVFKTGPIKLRTASWSGYDTFRIMSEFGTRTLVKGKVVRIAQRDVYFQVREDMYAIHLGQSLADAMRHRLTTSEMKALNLRIDEVWGAAERKEYLQELAKARKKGGR
jgi:hypothetical protein